MQYPNAHLVLHTPQILVLQFITLQLSKDGPDRMPYLGERRCLMGCCHTFLATGSWQPCLQTHGPPEEHCWGLRIPARRRLLAPGCQGLQVTNCYTSGGQVA